MGSAPKGRDSVAQGAALVSEAPNASAALKGRDSRAAGPAPFRPVGARNDDRATESPGLRPRCYAHLFSPIGGLGILGYRKKQESGRRGEKRVKEDGLCLPRG